MEEKQDNFVDGKCSQCGECCPRWLPLSNRDIKNIRTYLKKHDVYYAPKVISPLMVQETTFCPFLKLDQKTERCQIYPIRPTVCRLYDCKDHQHGKLNGHRKDYILRDLYEVFNLQ